MRPLRSSFRGHLHQPLKNYSIGGLVKASDEADIETTKNLIKRPLTTVSKELL
jgi:hypothetical protein